MRFPSLVSSCSDSRYRAWQCSFEVPAPAMCVVMTAYLIATGCSGSHPSGPLDGGGAEAPLRLPVGSACSSNPECETGLCVHLFGVDPDGVRATLTCGVAVGMRESQDECELGSDCATGLCAVSGRCVDACASDADCASMLMRCQVIEIAGGSDGTQRVNGCVARNSCGPDVVFAASAFAANVTGFPGEDTLRLPSGPGVSLHLVVAAEPLWLAPLELVTTDTRQSLFDARRDVYVNPVADGDPVVVMIPNAPHGVRAPSYDLTLIADRAGTVDVLSATRNSGGRVLDLDIFYLGGGNWSVVGVRGPVELDSALNEVNRLFGAAGIRIGVVRQHGVPGHLRLEFRVIDAGPMGEGGAEEIHRVMMLSAGLAAPSVPIFLVGEAGGALGLTGGPPGPQCFPGTRSSGIIIAVDTVLADPSVSLGRVIAHEIGHYLGLFHTTEAQVARPTAEPLSDTALCTAERDADGDGYLSAAECRGAGSENLMFHTAAGDALTPQQGEVLRSALILR